MPTRKRIVKDCFSFPEDDHALIASIEAKAARAGIRANKSEIVRAGLKALAGLNQTQLKKALGRVEKVKTGRPKDSAS